ncbi:MAG: cob(I)yrinic acid a,c-diamide adenosyltransferase [Candidatus Sungbacteria bacterium]|uniref:Cob(I)yrinic acid a,c-diamide adenosyltransferase n=1 Tax=Candidatus Sungiibacteriota bacterium TaxID=2750080 RepID=A0A932DSI4_9BACT|nr:cob(I)yrinic acid a,c-diamide adenosyltransferase [Candidatus Sungbacteria bacterium]MBI2465942.1 cob(I)yrinic acid a,c-diamide adenosyltransferase [Candidatus Sungbacteria bacterium]
MLIVITGNGKGKTTSALGQALRVVGEGGRAVMYQFIKGPWVSGEDKFFSNSQFSILNFQIIKGGLGFVGILGDSYPKSAHIKKAEETWVKAQEAIESKKYQLVVLDEINVAIKLGLLKISPVFSFLKKHKGIVNIMVTGREAHSRLIGLADLVSEIRDVKHPFSKGIGARKGIEY